MAEDEEVPDYLKKIQEGGPVDNGDNFTNEDVALGGLKEDFDLGEVYADRGFHEYGPIKLLAFALLAANQKDLSNDQLSSVADQIVKLVIGKDGRGNSEKDDEWLIRLVAKRVFEKLYGHELKYGFEQENPKPVKLKPIVTSVLEELAQTGEFKYGHSKYSDIVRIERKFKKNEGHYLARASMPKVNEEYLQRFKSACAELSRLGIKTDFSSFNSFE